MLYSIVKAKKQGERIVAVAQHSDLDFNLDGTIKLLQENGLSKLRFLWYDDEK